MKKLTLLIILLYWAFTSCTGSDGQGKAHITVTQRDTTITEENAYSDLFLDSTTVENYISLNQFTENTADRLRSFYNSRNYQFAWFQPDGLASQTAAFWNLHQNYLDYSKDSSLTDKWLHQQMKPLIAEPGFKVNPHDTTIIKTELELTNHFFQYAQNAYTGTIDPIELQWFIPRKKVDVVELLDSLIATKGKDLQNWEPVNQQYTLLREKLLQYYNIEKAGGWPMIDLGPKKAYKLGDTAAIISQIKQRLQQVGDMPQGDTANDFNISLLEAVKSVQHRFGLMEDGVIGAGTISRLNIPVKDRIQQLLINMERMRWLPKQPTGDYILVNIPGFTLMVMKDNKVLFSIDAVVGKAGHNTQVFSDKLQYVVFAPYWNVPASIVKNEILPAISRNPNYLSDNNMEQTGTANGLPVIRQLPGPDNALGRVKFIFPNSYNIYFHDTPAKSLFSNNNRAFSHGCIRLEDPFRLAQYLLQDQPQWTDSAIWDAMYGTKEKWVKLTHPVPVQITYFTAWIGPDGLLNFREDIYGHDAEMAKKLFAQ